MIITVHLFERVYVVEVVDDLEAQARAWVVSFNLLPIAAAPGILVPISVPSMPWLGH